MLFVKSEFVKDKAWEWSLPQSSQDRLNSASPLGMKLLSNLVLPTPVAGILLVFTATVILTL